MKIKCWFLSSFNELFGAFQYLYNDQISVFFLTGEFFVVRVGNF